MCQTPIWTAQSGCDLHTLPILPKDIPESPSKKPRVEEEVEKIIDEPLDDPDATDCSGDEIIDEEVRVVCGAV